MTRVPRRIVISALLGILATVAVAWTAALTTSFEPSDARFHCSRPWLEYILEEYDLRLRGIDHNASSPWFARRTTYNHADEFSFSGNVVWRLARLESPVGPPDPNPQLVPSWGTSASIMQHPPDGTRWTHRAFGWPILSMWCESTSQSPLTIWTERAVPSPGQPPPDQIIIGVSGLST